MGGPSSGMFKSMAPHAWARTAGGCLYGRPVMVVAGSRLRTTMHDLGQLGLVGWLVSGPRWNAIQGRQARKTDRIHCPLCPCWLQASGCKRRPHAPILQLVPGSRAVSMSRCLPVQCSPLCKPRLCQLYQISIMRLQKGSRETRPAQSADLLFCTATRR